MSPSFPLLLLGCVPTLPRWQKSLAHSPSDDMSTTRRAPRLSRLCPFLSRWSLRIVRHVRLQISV